MIKYLICFLLVPALVWGEENTMEEKEFGVDTTAMQLEYKTLLDYIPTYPNYIELENDLVIDFPNSDEPYTWDKEIFPKGTKIYYR